MAKAVGIGGVFLKAKDPARRYWGWAGGWGWLTL